LIRIVRQTVKDCIGERWVGQVIMPALDGAAINGTPTPNSIDGVIDNRGFTGHEMLDHLDLVHMNGRVYEPLLGRFLSADPILQDPMNGQSYNRYAYVFNNPTNLTDPTGFCAAGNEGIGSKICGNVAPNVSGATYLETMAGQASRQSGSSVQSGKSSAAKTDGQGNTKTDAKQPSVVQNAVNAVTETISDAASAVGSFVSEFFGLKEAGQSVQSAGTGLGAAQHAIMASQYGDATGVRHATAAAATNINDAGMSAGEAALGATNVTGAKALGTLVVGSVVKGAAKVAAAEAAEALAAKTAAGPRTTFTSSDDRSIRR
jgi:RHS repeat-associated protein